jgi:ribosome-associated protein
LPGLLTWCPGIPLLMVPIQIQTETIRLSQLLKLANVVQDGSEAKFRIANEEVTVNGALEIRRGKKIRNGDRVEFAGETYEVLVVASNSSM